MQNNCSGMSRLWNQYESQLSEYNKSNTQYQECHQYVVARRSAQRTIKECEKVLNTENLVVFLRETLSDDQFKKYLLKTYGPDTLFQYEQTQLAAVTANNSRVAAGAATIAAIGAVVAAYNTFDKE